MHGEKKENDVKFGIENSDLTEYGRDKRRDNLSKQQKRITDAIQKKGGA